MYINKREWATFVTTKSQVQILAYPQGRPGKLIDNTKITAPTHCT